jgi:hypothetical protein
VNTKSDPNIRLMLEAQRRAEETLDKTLQKQTLALEDLLERVRRQRQELEVLRTTHAGARPTKLRCIKGGKR